MEDHLPTPADLSALVVDRLDEIGKQIRTGNTDDWRQYWNEDHHGRPCTPETREFLPGCDPLRSTAKPPARSRCRAGRPVRQGHPSRHPHFIPDFQVPVEAKKNSHADLWRACRTQLIEQYTKDPATDGYGIYLVFWFGPDRTRRSPSGTRSANPQELQERLKETLSEDEARKISIRVIDVSGDL